MIFAKLMTNQNYHKIKLSKRKQYEWNEHKFYKKEV